jgi:hypothetical protein
LLRFPIAAPPPKILVKPPKSTNSFQTPHSIPEIFPQIVSHLPFQFAILKLETKTQARPLGRAFSFSPRANPPAHIHQNLAGENYMGRPKASDPSAASRTTTLGEGRVTKQKGELGELFFVLKAASLRFAVSKPYGDSLPFDFILGAGERMLRIQVKTAFSNTRHGFMIHAGFRGRGSKHTPYTAEDIDFIAAYVAPYEAWYIIPVGAIGTGTYPCIRVYPDGCRKLGSGRFEKYRDAWHLLTEAQQVSTQILPNEECST